LLATLVDFSLEVSADEQKFDIFLQFLFFSHLNQ
jgi:hypothetical protein